MGHKMQLKKLIIESNIPEKEFIESLFNMKYSGVDENHIVLFLSLHSMVNEWKYDKVVYYLNLLDIKREE